MWLIAGSFSWLQKGLSRMRGNLHVQFLGEGVAAMSLPYPTKQKVILNELQHKIRKTLKK